MRGLGPDVLGAILLMGLASPVAAGCFVVKAESDLNGLRLHDPASARRVLGAVVAQTPAQQAEAKRTNTMTIVSIFNRDRREMAVASAYPGAEPGSFAFIKMGDPNEKPRATSVVLPVDHLSTERGIRIGVSEAFVTRLLGRCYTREATKDGITLEYLIGYKTHPLLKRGGATSYSAHYTFRAGRLVSFILWL